MYISAELLKSINQAVSVLESQRPGFDEAIEMLRTHPADLLAQKWSKLATYESDDEYYSRELAKLWLCDMGIGLGRPILTQYCSRPIDFMGEETVNWEIEKTRKWRETFRWALELGRDAEGQPVTSQLNGWKTFVAMVNTLDLAF